MPTELPGVQPMLVELRSLEKAPSLDELLGQHLIRSGVENVNPRKLEYMIRSGRLALLFDGFDELELRVGYDNAADYLRVLLGSVSDRAKVVLTSRTQHFLSSQQVRTALGDRVAGLGASRVVVLEDFDREQILAFLTNQYGSDRERAQARFDLLGHIEDLLGLSRNPRMLAFISALDEDRLRAIEAEHGRISAAELYRELVEFWLVGEADRQRHRGGLPSLNDTERLTACTDLALKLWASTAPTIPVHALSATASATLTRLSERGYDTAQAAHTIGSGTLLVRTEDGAFAFVHSSIMEWLVAEAAARELAADGASEILGRGRVSRLMAEFLADLAGRDACAGWATRTLTDGDASAVAKQNAVTLQGRTTADRQDVRPPGARQSLTGVDLRDQDLTGRDLRGADLRGADLRGMRLVDVDLAGADLREADVRKAILCAPFIPTAPRQCESNRSGRSTPESLTA